MRKLPHHKKVKKIGASEIDTLCNGHRKDKEGMRYDDYSKDFINEKMERYATDDVTSMPRYLI